MLLLESSLRAIETMMLKVDIDKNMLSVITAPRKVKANPDRM